MVQAAPKTFSTDEGKRRRAPEPVPIGLSQKRRAELEDFFCRHEADVGVRSTFGDAVARIAQSRAAEDDARQRRATAERERRRREREGSKEGPAILTISDLVTARPTKSRAESHPVDVDELYSSLSYTGALGRARTVRAALERLEDEHLVVLYRVCGPRNTTREHAELGDLAPLADLTEAAEALRDEYACEEGLDREDRAATGLALAVVEKLEELAETFWESVACETDLRARAYVARDPGEKARLEERADAEVELRGLVLARHEDVRAREGQSVLSARLTALASADKEISAADALRRRLEERPSPRADKAAKQAHADARAVFLGEVARQSRAIWLAASRAWLDARFEDDGDGNSSSHPAAAER